MPRLTRAQAAKLAAEEAAGATTTATEQKEEMMTKQPSPPKQPQQQKPKAASPAPPTPPVPPAPKVAAASPAPTARPAARPSSTSSSSTTKTTTKIAFTSSTTPGSRLYEHAKALQEKRQSQQRQMTPEGCTFKPVLATKGKKTSTPTTSSSSDDDPLTSTTKRFERLYLDAQTRAAKLEEAKAKQQQQLPAASTMTKKPTSVLPPPPSGTTKKPSSPALLPPPVPAGVNRLYEQAKIQRERQVQRAAEAATSKECTFKPAILHKRASSTTRVRDGDDAAAAPTSSSFVERAMDYQKKVEAKVASLKKEQQERENTTFKPKIPSKAGVVSTARRGGESVFDYLAKSGTTTTTMHHNKTEEKSSSSNIKTTTSKATTTTIKPVMAPPAPLTTASTKRRPLSLGGKEGKDLFARLHGEAVLKEERLKKQEAESVALATKECTFAPQLPSPMILTAAATTSSSSSSSATKKTTTLMAKSNTTTPTTATPTIPPKQPFPATSSNTKKGGSDVFNRLYGETKLKPVLFSSTDASPTPSLSSSSSPAPPPPSFSSPSPKHSPATTSHTAPLSSSSTRKSEEGGRSKQAPTPPTSTTASGQSAGVAPPSSGSSSSPPLAFGGIFDRLAQEASLRKERETERERLKEEMELEGCTFSPQVSSSFPLPKSSSPLRLSKSPSKRLMDRESMEEGGGEGMEIDEEQEEEECFVGTECEAVSIMSFGNDKAFTPPMDLSGLPEMPMLMVATPAAAVDDE